MKRTATLATYAADGSVIMSPENLMNYMGRSVLEHTAYLFRQVQPSMKVQIDHALFLKSISFLPTPTAEREHLKPWACGPDVSSVRLARAAAIETFKTFNDAVCQSIPGLAMTVGRDDPEWANRKRMQAKANTVRPGFSGEDTGGMGSEREDGSEDGSEDGGGVGGEVGCGSGGEGGEMSGEGSEMMMAGSASIEPPVQATAGRKNARRGKRTASKITSPTEVGDTDDEPDNLGLGTRLDGDEADTPDKSVVDGGVERSKEGDAREKDNENQTGIASEGRGDKGHDDGELDAEGEQDPDYEDNHGASMEEGRTTANGMESSAGGPPAEAVVSVLQSSAYLFHSTYKTSE